jgi:hypothetical protein
MKKNEKIKTQKSFSTQTQTPARFCVGLTRPPILASIHDILVLKAFSQK